jgi:phosphoribosylaminoimidazole carboxylase (NCAIR synthetase)
MSTTPGYDVCARACFAYHFTAVQQLWQDRSLEVPVYGMVFPALLALVRIRTASTHTPCVPHSNLVRQGNVCSLVYIPPVRTNVHQVTCTNVLIVMVLSRPNMVGARAVECNSNMHTATILNEHCTHAHGHSRHVRRSSAIPVHVLLLYTALQFAHARRTTFMVG